MEGGGFEPPKAEPADLQSAPFGRSGTPPERKRRSLMEIHLGVNSVQPLEPKIEFKIKLLVSENNPLYSYSDANFG